MTPFSSSEAPYGSFIGRLSEYCAAFPSYQAYGTAVSLSPGLRLRSLFGQSSTKEASAEERDMTL